MNRDGFLPLHLNIHNSLLFLHRHLIRTYCFSQATSGTAVTKTILHCTLSVNLESHSFFNSRRISGCKTTPRTFFISSSKIITSRTFICTNIKTFFTLHTNLLHYQIVVTEIISTTTNNNFSVTVDVVTRRCVRILRRYVLS